MNLIAEQVITKKTSNSAKRKVDFFGQGTKNSIF